MKVADIKWEVGMCYVLVCSGYDWIFRVKKIVRSSIRAEYIQYRIDAPTHGSISPYIEERGTPLVSTSSGDECREATSEDIVYLDHCLAKGKFVARESALEGITIDNFQIY